MIDGLKPCPVCKHVYDIHYYQEGLARRDEVDFWFIDDAISHCIECDYCGHYVEDLSLDRAKEKWNSGEISKWEEACWAKQQAKENE